MGFSEEKKKSNQELQGRGFSNKATTIDRRDVTSLAVVVTPQVTHREGSNHLSTVRKCRRFSLFGAYRV